jgi:hypothetical protein
MSQNFLLERDLPGSEPRRFIIEDEIIPFLPEAPSTDHKNIHEERLLKIPFGDEELPVHIGIIIMHDTNGKLTTSGSRTIKKEMLNRFFHTITAKHTIVTFIEMLFPSFQNIFGVEPII